MASDNIIGSKDALKRFLETGIEPTAKVVEIEVTAGNQMADDPVAGIVAGLNAVGMIAKDLHYHAKGKAFYAVHELADLVWQVRGQVDELIEVYYLGEQQRTPPPMGVFCSLAIVKANRFYDSAAKTPAAVSDEDRILQALVLACDAVVADVENAKEIAFHSGTNAVLDEISKKTLQSRGLLARSIRGGEQG